MPRKRIENQNRCDAGFTIVELVIVMAILAILAAVATDVLLRELPKAHLQDAARMLMGDIQSARLSAVRNGTSCSIEQLPTANSYRIVQNGAVMKTVTLPKDVFFGSLNSLSPAPDSGTFPGERLTCQPTGLTSSGSFFLKCSSSGYGSEIQVSSLGRPKIRKWNGSSYL